MEQKNYVSAEKILSIFAQKSQKDFSLEGCKIAKTPRLYEFIEIKSGAKSYRWTLWVKTAAKQSFILVLLSSNEVKVYDKRTLDDKYNYHNANKVA